VIPAGICFSTRRHLLQHGLRHRGDLCLRRRHIRPRLEIDLDDASAVQRLALDVLDVADRRRERALVVVNHPSRHVLRRETVIGPHHGDDGDADVREDVGRRAQCGTSAENENQYRQNGERIRPLQGYEDNRIHTSMRSTRTTFGLAVVDTQLIQV
jgi:hypothetical protein